MTSIYLYSLIAKLRIAIYEADPKAPNVAMNMTKGDPTFLPSLIANPANLNTVWLRPLKHPRTATAASIGTLLKSFSR